MVSPLTAARDRLRREGARGLAYAAAWSAAVDAWLAPHVAEALGDDPDGVAVVAVGGYGRGLLTPRSDLDLLLVHRRSRPPVAAADRLWYPVWDEGFTLGHAVRTVPECLDLASEDLATATALLDVRHLGGDEELSGELARAALDRWRGDARDNLVALRASVRDRQARHGEVAFLLEPELKEGRGGIRDVHALRWAERARPVLEDGDAGALDAAEAVLVDARVARHLVGRGDRLTFQDQDAVAGLLGVGADELMADVARAARTVAWIGDEAWDRVEASVGTSTHLLGWRSATRAPGFVIRAGQVHLEPGTDPATGPEVALDAAVLAAGHGVRLSRDALRRLVDRTPPVAEPWTEALRDRFVSLLAQGRRAVPVVEALDEVGLWARFLPEWDAVRSRPQRNAYHRFTVDRHLLEAVANASSLLARVDRPDLLLLGALLHDIGKGLPGDHTENGVEQVTAIAARIGLDDPDAAVLVDLVRHHLLLPDAATRRDLDDPTTIARVAEEVGDPLRLQLLGALTRADSLATGPAAWSSWKAGLVDDLVRRVDHHLRGGSPDALRTASFPDVEERALLDARETAVRASGAGLVVVTPDRVGLFARVTGVLALHGIDVLAADALVDDGWALERFAVAPRFGAVVPWERVVPQLEAALAGRLALEARLAERRRTYRVPDGAVVPPTVRFDDAASRAATVVEVQATDRVGLLHRVGRAFAELDLDVGIVKAQTMGDVVVDAFYVTHAGGGLVVDPDVRAELERALRHALS